MDITEVTFSDRAATATLTVWAWPSALVAAALATCTSAEVAESPAAIRTERAFTTLCRPTAVPAADTVETSETIEAR